MGKKFTPVLFYRSVFLGLFLFVLTKITFFFATYDILENTRHDYTWKNKTYKIQKISRMKVVEPIRMSSNNNITTFKNTYKEQCPKPELFEIETDLNIPEMFDNIEMTGNEAGNIDVLEVNESRWTKDNKLKVFVVLHSHNDPGWIYTMENYYLSQTQFILDNVLRYLTDDPDLKFIWSEISLFDMWWKDLSAKKRSAVRDLVNNGQLEIVGGGWVMHDEASPHYFSMVLQLIEGHQWLRQHLNYTPSNGWAIDPFGLSSTSSFLQQRFGLKNTVFSRIHYSLRALLVAERKTEFYWRQLWDSSGNTDLYCYQMPYGSYDISSTCGLAGVGDASCRSYRLFKRLPGTDYGHNVTADVKATSMLLLNKYREKSQIFRTNNLLVPLGGDFAWQTNREWNNDIGNLKSIFEYINSQPDLHTEVKFATLNEYFEAVHKDRKGQTKDNSSVPVGVEQVSGWKTPVFSGDFFTYADHDEEYWSGYYTSRIFHKASDRQLMTLVRSSQLIYTFMAAELSKAFGTLEFKFIGNLLHKIVESRRTFSLFQHHDAITGTSTDEVVRDYALKLFHAMHKSHLVIQQCMHILQLIQQLKNVKTGNQSHSVNLNMEAETKTAINSTDDKEVFYEAVMNKSEPESLWKDNVYRIDSNSTLEVISVFNSLAKTRKQLVRVSVTSTDVKVLGSKNQEIASEIYPVFEYHNKFPNRSTSTVLKDASEEDDDESKSSFKKPKAKTKLKSAKHFELFFIAELRPLEVKHFKIIFDTNSKNVTSSSKVRVRIFNTEAQLSHTLANKFLVSDLNDSNIQYTSSKNKTIQISNHYMTVSFNENGTASFVEIGGISYPLSITFHRYRTEKSGLYIFVPHGKAVPLHLSKVDPVIIVIEGRLRSYVEIWLPFVRHRLTLINHNGLESYAIHVDNIVDIRNTFNFELIMKIRTDIKSGTEFFTDSNGFQMMRREYRKNLPIQGNYYPIASTAFIEDADLRLTVLAAQPGGCASLISGQLEIMLDRKLNQDDVKGVNQGGTDNLESALGFKITLEKPSSSSSACRLQDDKSSDGDPPLPLLSLEANLQQLQFLHPQLIYRKVANQKCDRCRNSIDSDYTPSRKKVPCDIHLVGAIPLVEFSDSNTTKQVFMKPLSQSALLFTRMGIDGRFQTRSNKLLKYCYYRNNANTTHGNIYPGAVNPFRFAQLKVKNVFGELFREKMLQTSLSLSQKTKYMNASKGWRLKPMEIYPFIADYYYKSVNSRSEINTTIIIFDSPKPKALFQKKTSLDDLYN